MLASLKTELCEFKIGSDYSVEIDDSKGSEIDGYEQLTIKWNESGLFKLVQILPEISDKKIKNWKIWICAYKIENDDRYWWNEVIFESKKKKDILSKARGKLEEGIKTIAKISEDQLKLIQN